MHKLSYIKRLIVFFVLNFSALALGAYLQFGGVTSDWYWSLNQASWTPPGWFFGFAWTTIMICFSFYMASLTTTKSKTTLVLFGLQFILNVIWNPVFFYFHEVIISLFSISALTILIAYFLFNHKKKLGWKTTLIVPYFIWLLIATSLNAYIFLYN